MSTSDSVRVVAVEHTGSTYRVTFQYDTGIPSTTRPTFSIEVADSVAVSRFKVGSTVLNVRDLASLVEALGGGLPQIPFSAVVFRPGGVASGNIYVTWAALYAAFTALGTSVTRVIYFDNTSGACLIPTGPYDMTNTRWLKQPGVVGIVPVALSVATVISPPPISIDSNLSLTA